MYSSNDEGASQDARQYQIDDEAASVAEPEEDPYWANASPEKIGSEIKERAAEYYDTLVQTGLIELWRSVHAAYYGLSQNGTHDSSKIVEFGDDGEKLGLKSNQLRSLVRYMLSSVTADKMSTKPMASNATPEALSQIPTARRVLEFFNKTKRMDRKYRGAALRALLYGKSYLWQAWDPNIGKPAPAPPQDPNTPPAPTQEAKPEGDIVARACSPMEVACDLDRDAYDHDYFIVRRPRNRYDLIATYASGTTPEQLKLKEDIEGISTDCVEAEVSTQISFGFRRREKDTRDILFEYHFMHRKTPAVPRGRYTIMVGDGKVLFDGPLPYQDVPISECVPEEFLEAGSIGYASAWDLLGLQQAYDAVLSTCMTNFDAFGHNDILIPEGVELAVEEIRDGLNVIRYPAGEFNRPSMLEKFSIKEEVFKLREWIKSDMEVTSGVNATARGEPGASLKSGSALALVQAQAVHFQSGFMAAYSGLIEDGNTTTLQIVKDFATTERVASISGDQDPDGLISFSSKDVNQIERVQCEAVNPIFATLAGKFDIANNLLERGLLKDIGQYYEVLETGRLEPVTDPDRQADLYAASVRAALLKGPGIQPKPPAPPVPGQPPQPQKFSVQGLRVVISDDPIKHLRIGKSVLDSQEARNNPQVAQAATTYMLDVLDTWRSAPPDFLQLLGYPMPPPPPGMPQPMPQGQPQQAPGEKPPSKQQPMPNEAKSDAGGTQGAPDQGKGMPNMPKVAKTPQTVQ